MKKLSSLKLSSIVFGIFMLLPMFSILSRVIYIQSNPNAKDSYYGETINETSLRNIEYDNLEINNTYYFIKQELGNLVSSTSLFYNVSNVSNNFNQLTTCNRIRFTIDYVTFYNFDTYISAIQLTNSACNVKFDFQGIYSSQTNASNINDYLFVMEYNDYSYLDNVFDYSLKTFLEDDNNYSINFFNFFGNTFLNQSGNNMLYLNFLNWYMNYGLLVSCGYILFFILYFFINVIRKLVLSFTNKIDGGF